MNVSGLTRCAFFQGRIIPGREQEFYQYVEQVMLPLWQKFPNVRHLRVCTQHTSDTLQPAYPLVMMMGFDCEEDIAEALSSDVRAESQNASRKLIAMFEGTIFHTVFNHLHADK